jgi:uncharacterized membrane protein
VPTVSLTQLVDRLAVVTAFIRRLVELLGEQALLVDTEVRTAAGELAKTATAVLGVVKGAIEAIGAVEKFVPTVSLTQLVDRLAVVTAFIRRLVELLGEQALLVDTEVRTAAANLAAVAGPVLGVVKSAIEAIGAVEKFVPVANLAMLDAGMTQIVGFVGLLVQRLGEVGQQVNDDVRAAAQTLITVAEPALNLLKAALETMVNLSRYLPIPDLPGLDRGMQAIVAFIQELVQRVGTAGTQVAGVRQAALDFIAVAQPAMQLLREGLELLAVVPNAPDVALLERLMDAIVAYVNRLGGGIGGIKRQIDADIMPVVDGLADEARTVRERFDGAIDDLQGIGAGLDRDGLFDVGLGAMSSLAAGLASGIELVRAELREAADVLTTGPLWEAGTFAATVGGGAPATGPVTINFTYAPAVSLASQREAEEVIAPMLLRVLAREARRV